MSTTALGVFIIPGKYTFVEGLFRRKRPPQTKSAEAPPQEPPGAHPEH